jgi:hypothetical protein
MTLDDDVARALRAVAQERGKPFEQVVNDAPRLGLEARLDPPRVRASAQTLDSIACRSL